MSKRETLHITGPIGFILNTKAANNDEFRLAIHNLRQTLSRHKKDNVPLYVEVAWEYAQIAEKCKLLIDRGVKLIVAVGGDGTLNGVASAIHFIDRSIEMAVLPHGTANDFAHYLGLAKFSIPDAILYILSLKAQPIDLGYVSSHRRFFLNVATGGVGAEVTSNTSPELKRYMGGFAYILSGIQSLHEFTPMELTIEMDGKVWNKPTIGFAIGNGTQTGGGLQICRNAKLDDGLLDVVVAPSMALPAIREYFFGDVADSDEILYQTARSVSISSPKELQMNLDGEPIEGTFFKIEVVKEGLLLRRECVDS